MAIAFVAAGAAATGTTSLSIAFPAGISAGNLLAIAVANKYPANGPATPTDFIAPSDNQGSGGQGASGGDAGNVYATAFYKVATGSESGSVTVGIASGNSAIGRMFAYSNATGLWSVACTFGADNTADTSWSVTGGADPGVTTGDVVLAISAINGADGTQQAASQAITQTGITYGAMTERQDSGTSAGDNSHLVVSEHPVTSGTSSDVPVYTFTADTTIGANAPAGATVLMRLRESSAAATSLIWSPEAFFNHLLVR